MLVLGGLLGLQARLRYNLGLWGCSCLLLDYCLVVCLLFVIDVLYYYSVYFD